MSFGFWILNLGFFVVRSSLNSLLFFRFWMSLSSVSRMSHWFMAAERMRQSMKSFSVFRSLKAVRRS